MCGLSHVVVGRGRDESSGGSGVACVEENACALALEFSLLLLHRQGRQTPNTHTHSQLPVASGKVVVLWVLGFERVRSEGRLSSFVANQSQTTLHRHIKQPAVLPLTLIVLTTPLTHKRAFPHPTPTRYTGRALYFLLADHFKSLAASPRRKPPPPRTTPSMKVTEAFSLLGLSPSTPPDEGTVRAAFKELALPFLALGEGDSLRHTRLWELCQAYEVRVCEAQEALRTCMSSFSKVSIQCRGHWPAGWLSCPA